MKFAQSVVLSAAFAVSMAAGTAVAADVPQLPPGKPAVRHFLHPEHCHPGMGHGHGMMGGYGMGGYGMGGYGMGG
ncbi:MAG TPA: hypothetical protein PLK99_11280, partial [Burkholderiales bacterium]|nr:hypothetical protein [Burkholderiales bacterium]